jgi:diguanylate cyclase (GGDEF)-like protein
VEVSQLSDEGRQQLEGLLADDRIENEKIVEGLRDLRERLNIRAYSVLLYRLAHLLVGEGQAERLLDELLRHREDLSRALGRDPGLRVAAIDYLSNVKQLLTNPTIVERAQLEKTERSAITDALTLLYNRRHFMRALGLEVRRSQRYSQPLSVLMLDLDEFKQLNDRHGHLFGDLVLERVGQVLRRAVRQADVPCRFGGEEFAVILPETDRLGAHAVAERIRQRVERAFAERAVETELVRVTISGGIASYPEDGREIAELIAAADQALYASKSRGKNVISLYHSERRTAIRYPARSGAKASLERNRGRGSVHVRPLNLSISGALIEVLDDLDSARTVNLTFAGRDRAGQPRSWSLDGRVVRVEDSHVRERRRIAVAFERPLPEECLVQQIQRTRPARAARAAPGGRA